MKIEEKSPHVSNWGDKKDFLSSLRGYRLLRQDHSGNFEANFNKTGKKESSQLL
jgi:hypothetical protein